MGTARKNWRPDRGHQFPLVKEGAAAAAVQEAAKRTTSRREMSRGHGRFEQVSPEVGELDESAFEEAMNEDPDEALAMLADLTAATDPKLREIARRLAGRLLLDLSRRGPVHRAASARSSPSATGPMATSTSTPVSSRSPKRRRAVAVSTSNVSGCGRG